MKYTQEQLMDLAHEARLRYPAGTVYKCPSSTKTHTVVLNHRLIYTVWEDRGINAGFEKGFFWYKDKWAEVISYPEGCDPGIINDSYILI